MSAWNCATSAVGDGCGGRKPCAIDSPASSGIASATAGRRSGTPAKTPAAPAARSRRCSTAECRPRSRSSSAPSACGPSRTRRSGSWRCAGRRRCRRSACRTRRPGRRSRSANRAGRRCPSRSTCGMVDSGMPSSSAATSDATTNASSGCTFAPGDHQGQQADRQGDGQHGPRRPASSRGSDANGLIIVMGGFLEVVTHACAVDATEHIIQRRVDREAQVLLRRGDRIDVADVVDLEVDAQAGSRPCTTRPRST
jgi:hypothetical protein